ncbi:hypothetical protein SKAU_G00055540 [Synaphobranchus kaupii]|uniref:Uncharacterized protein n=1 Tax=Synaphobranchus kaupii TaxID=118154 RepID=A0A9Q1G3U9_SYNKA|nr:hypothetical protein SKAU_G00055540 [Synaphobranchus kaupii]
MRSFLVIIPEGYIGRKPPPPLLHRLYPADIEHGTPPKGLIDSAIVAPRGAGRLPLKVRSECGRSESQPSFLRPKQDAKQDALYKSADLQEIAKGQLAAILLSHVSAKSKRWQKPTREAEGKIRSASRQQWPSRPPAGPLPGKSFLDLTNGGRRPVIGEGRRAGKVTRRAGGREIEMSGARRGWWPYSLGEERSHRVGGKDGTPHGFIATSCAFGKYNGRRDGTIECDTALLPEDSVFRLAVHVTDQPCIKTSYVYHSQISMHARFVTLCCV